MQYDTLLDSKYTDYLKKEQDGSLEIGGWFEIVAQQTKDAGIVWRGRPGYSWDWHSHVGFLVGYTQEERKKLIDVYMDQFFTIFGYYPKAMGSWFIDAWSINYMAEKYRVKAICICRDQWGTDGYNLWGGYFNVYYPSRNNMFTPGHLTPSKLMYRFSECWEVIRYINMIWECPEIHMNQVRFKEFVPWNRFIPTAEEIPIG